MLKMKRNPGPPGSSGRVNVIHNKGSKMLPGRAGVNALLEGNPWERNIQNYAKLTPSGRNGPMTYQDIINMAHNTTKVGQ